MTDRLAAFTLFGSIGFLAFGAIVGVLYRWDAVLTNVGF